MVGRSASSPDLRGSHLLPCTNLDELCQRGGCNILKLPADFSPSESLKVPRCLAAMGNYIVDNGESTLRAYLRENVY